MNDIYYWFHRVRNNYVPSLGSGWCPPPSLIWPSFVPTAQVAMPHQWLEGNLPVSAKCAVCDKTCGSVLRLQDWKCLWCKTMVRALYNQLPFISFSSQSLVARPPMVMFIFFQVSSLPSGYFSDTLFVLFILVTYFLCLKTSFPTALLFFIML